jgi:pimeloyl-ACP methyl ester carboxylesterase
MPALNCIPYIDFGGPGPLLHFAHANGYPPGAYRPLFERLAIKFHLLAMHMRPLWPGASPKDITDWQPLSEDIARFFEQQGLSRPIGAGHSMGATATLRLALQRPELFSALVLIDPVFFLPWMVRLWDMIHRLGLDYKLHPLIKGALRRRNLFNSKEAMFANYREKAVFARIDDHGLRAYVEAMAQTSNNGQVKLAYSPIWESHIYATGVRGDMDIWRTLASLKPPLLIIRGDESDTFREVTARRVQNLLPQASMLAIPGAGHLVPLEKPVEVHTEIQAFLERKLIL